MNTKYVYIVHDTDADGCCAAWIASETVKYHDLQSDNNTTITFIPLRAGEELSDSQVATIIDKPEETLVVVVDRSLEFKTLHLLCQNGIAVSVYDHHKTTVDKLIKDVTPLHDDYAILIRENGKSILITSENLSFLYKSYHSGCGIAYEIALDMGVRFKVDPWFILYVEDRDLWLHKLPYTKELNAYIGLQKPSVQLFNALYEEQLLLGYDKPNPMHIKIGHALLVQKENIIKSIVESNVIIFEKHFDVVVAVTMDLPYVYISDIAQYLFSMERNGKHPIPDVLVAISTTNDYMWKTGSNFNESFVGSMPHKLICSFRSKEHSVSEVAKQLGGGGHALACGFSTEEAMSQNECLNSVVQLVAKHIHNQRNGSTTP